MHTQFLTINRFSLVIRDLLMFSIGPLRKSTGASENRSLVHTRTQRRPRLTSSLLGIWLRAVNLHVILVVIVKLIAGLVVIAVVLFARLQLLEVYLVS